jgi:hypothetical protein
MLNEKDVADYKADGYKQPEANDKQIGGEHYKQFKGMEPWDVITGWGLGYLDGTALKYIARWKYKNGIEDLEKAVHFLQKAIEVHKKNAN